MKNYIEYIREGKDKDRGVEWDVYYAVKPTPYRYRNKPFGDVQEVDETWAVYGGQPVNIHSLSDIEGLRGLLDEVEKEMRK